MTFDNNLLDVLFKFLIPFVCVQLTRSACLCRTNHFFVYLNRLDAFKRKNIVAARLCTMCADMKLEWTLTVAVAISFCESRVYAFSLCAKLNLLMSFRCFITNEVFRWKIIYCCFHFCSTFISVASSAEDAISDFLFSSFCILLRFFPFNFFDSSFSLFGVPVSELMLLCRECNCAHLKLANHVWLLSITFKWTKTNWIPKFLKLKNESLSLGFSLTCFQNHFTLWLICPFSIPFIDKLDFSKSITKQK